MSAPSRGVRFDAPIPVYLQIANVLRERVRQMGVGARLPSESKLAAEFGVSRLTVRQAMARLHAERLIIRLRGKGTEIARTPEDTVRVRRLIGSLEDDRRALGRTTRFKVLERRIESASLEVAARLKVRAGAEVVRIDRVLQDQTGPLARIMVWLPVEIGDKLEGETLENSTLLALLGEKHGLRVSQSEQTILATLADVYLADLLNISVGAPVLRAKGLFVDESDRPVMHLIIDYRADRYEYSVTTR